MSQGDGRERGRPTHGPAEALRTGRPGRACRAGARRRRLAGSTAATASGLPGPPEGGVARRAIGARVLATERRRGRARFGTHQLVRPRRGPTGPRVAGRVPDLRHAAKEGWLVVRAHAQRPSAPPNVHARKTRQRDPGQRLGRGAPLPQVVAERARPVHLLKLAHARELAQLVHLLYPHHARTAISREGRGRGARGSFTHEPAVRLAASEGARRPVEGHEDRVAGLWAVAHLVLGAVAVPAGLALNGMAALVPAQRAPPQRRAHAPYQDFGPKKETAEFGSTASASGSEAASPMTSSVQMSYSGTASGPP